MLSICRVASFDVCLEEYIAISIAIIENNKDNKDEYSFSMFIRFPINDMLYDFSDKDTKENKEHSAQFKHHHQLKTTDTYLLPYLADPKNNDQKKALTYKRSGGGK